jgi:GNAT superfamily N-acetyltransferase
MSPTKAALLEFRTHDMTFQIKPRHDFSPNEIDAIEDRLYEHNSYATGRSDSQGLGFVIRNEVGQMIGVAAGFTWSGTFELKQMWIDEAYRGRGYARALLTAFVTEACSRGVRRIRVVSHDFQAPGCMKRQASRAWQSLKDGPRAAPMWFSAKHYQVGKSESLTRHRGLCPRWANSEHRSIRDRIVSAGTSRLCFFSSDEWRVGPIIVIAPRQQNARFGIASEHFANVRVVPALLSLQIRQFAHPLLKIDLGFPS